MYFWKHHLFNSTLIYGSLSISNIRPSSVTSTDHLPEPQGPAHQLIPPVISEALRQSAGLILARISDVTHHPMSHITYAHNIPTSNTILGVIYNPLRYNDITPIFATLPPPPPVQTCSKQGANVGKPPNYLTSKPQH